MVSMRTLECLVSIVEHGSLTRAAAVLHMSQPALSHQIAALERELGTPVIERRPRGVVLPELVAAPHDDLLRQFTGDLKRRGLPGSRVLPGRLGGPGVRQPLPHAGAP
jgi:DNA-binding transcriptional LysR family regulator